MCVFQAVALGLRRTLVQLLHWGLHQSAALDESRGPNSSSLSVSISHLIVSAHMNVYVMFTSVVFFLLHQILADADVWQTGRVVHSDCGNAQHRERGAWHALKIYLKLNLMISVFNVWLLQVFHCVHFECPTQFDSGVVEGSPAHEPSQPPSSSASSHV